MTNRKHAVNLSSRRTNTLWQNRDLFWQFTVRNVEMKHRGTLLGLAWAVLNPLIQLSLYVFVFGYVFGGKFGAIPDESRWDHGLAIFLGLSLFHLVSEAVAVAPTIILNCPSYVKKVVFPLEILPASAVGASVIHMGISLAMVMVGVLVGGRGLPVSVLWLPVLVVPMILLALGMTWLFSALGVFFRDLAQIAGAMTTALLFASAVFYRPTEIPESFSFLRLNPIVHAIELARRATLWDLPIGGGQLAYLYASAFATCILGYLVFRRLRPAFADVM